MTKLGLKTAILKFPHWPGIYIFRDSLNKPLYIGKAFDLKKRISQYLKTENIRLKKMISSAKNVSFIKTDSEIEALVTESQYIKKYQPTFNIMLRDDKNFFYVGFTKNKWSKIFLSHQPHKKFKTQILNSKSNSNVLKLKIKNLNFHSDSAEWVGPFTDGTALKTTLRYLRKIFPYCTCKKPHNNFCLNYHIGKCPGVCCLKNISIDIKIRQQYLKNIRAIKDILSGKKTSLLKGLEKEMVKLGKEEKFQEAIELRDKIEKIKRVFENARIIQNIPYYDISNNQSRSVLLELKKILRQKRRKVAWRPRRFTRPPRRIEGYDVANIQGKYAVGAMVVFIDGKPSKNEYRKFKVRNSNIEIRNKFKTINSKSKTFSDFGFRASNFRSDGDVGMLKEILTRRLNHPEWPLPDLIIVDGGKAQLNMARSVVTNYYTTFFKKQRAPLLIALAKDDRHRGSKLYVSGKKNSIPLSRLPVSVKNLLLHVDSEAHQFAIAYYRHRHRKALF